MSTSLQIRRGTTTQINAMTPESSEPIHNIDNDELIIGSNKAVIGSPKLTNQTKNASHMGKGITSGNNVQVTIDGSYGYEELRKIEFIQDVDALAPLTLSINNGANLPCIDGEGESVSLKANTVYVCWKDTDGTAVFQLASRTGNGGVTPVIGGVKFSTKYDGIDSEIKDEDGNTVNVVLNEYVYLDGDVSAKIVGTGGTVPIDRTNPVEIVGSDYSTEGSNGRKLVKLDNGTLVAVLKDSPTQRFRIYVSTDNGASWIAKAQIVSNGGSVSSLKQGNNVLYVFDNGDKVQLVKFNPSTDTGDLTPLVSAIDSNQTSYSGVTLIDASNGDLHCAWSSKNSNYHYFNIRYSKSIDGGLNWATPEQVSMNSAQSINPFIIIGLDSKPHIVFDYDYDGGSQNVIKIANYATSWTLKMIYLAGNYVQNNPCAIVKNSGEIIVVWSGMDSTHTTNENIILSKSSDNGLTWSTKEMITSVNKMQINPSINVDKNDKIFIIWNGIDSSVSTTIKQIRLVSYDSSWSQIENLTNVTSGAQPYFPSLCLDVKDFIKPLAVWVLSTVGVKFYGKWGGGVPEQIFKKMSEVSMIDEVKCTIAGTLLFNSPSFGDRVTGFKSIVDLVT